MGDEYIELAKPEMRDEFYAIVISSQQSLKQLKGVIRASAVAVRTSKIRLLEREHTKK